MVRKVLMHKIHALGDMKIKFVLESQRATGRYRLEIEASSMAELHDILRLFETLSKEETSDEYLKELSNLGQRTIRAWMETKSLEEGET
jgi:hypothetical protein